MSRTFKDRLHKNWAENVPHWFHNYCYYIGWVTKKDRQVRRSQERAKENQAVLMGKEELIPFIRKGQDAWDNW